MSTKAELEMENTELRGRLAELEGMVSPSVPVRRLNREPSFGICAGVAADLAMHGRARDPFTGELRTADQTEVVTYVDEDMAYDGPDESVETPE